MGRFNDWLVGLSLLWAAFLAIAFLYMWTHWGRRRRHQHDLIWQHGPPDCVNLGRQEVIALGVLGELSAHDASQRAREGSRIRFLARGYLPSGATQNALGEFPVAPEGVPSWHAARAMPTRTLYWRSAKRSASGRHWCSVYWWSSRALSTSTPLRRRVPLNKTETAAGGP
jgi:hypothetical protein